MNIKDLQNYLSEYAKIISAYRTKDFEEETLSEPEKILDYKQLQSFLKEVEAAINHSKKNGDFVNVWEIAGIDDDELKNTQILSWFLDINGSHGQGNIFLKKLLDYLKISDNKNKLDHYIKDYNTYTEFCPLGDNSNRIDLVIEGEEILIYIEVKINSLEHNDQTTRYSKILEKSTKKIKKLIYLTKSGVSSHSKQANSLTWNEVALIFNKAIEGNSVPEFIKKK